MSQHVKTHSVTTKVTFSERYPYRAVCSCGWHSWGYLTDFAAGGMGDDHIRQMQEAGELASWVPSEIAS